MGSKNHRVIKTLLVFALTASMAIFSEIKASPGYPDQTFGDGGSVITSFTWPNMHGNTNPRDLAIQEDGKIVVVGTLDNVGFVRPILVRYNPDGTLDTTFGTGGGKMIPNFDHSRATSMAIQPDGRIVVVGSQYRPTLSTEEDFIARFETNGWYDASFGLGGILSIQMGGGAEDVVVQPDGKILIVGGSTDGSALVRLNPNGSFDTSFDGDGKALVPGSTSRVLVQPDQKIVVAGTKEGQSMLARFNPDGLLDSSFDGDGVTMTAVGLFDDDYNDVVVQPDGKILAIGIGTEDIDGDLYYVTFIGRYHPTGALDDSFNSDGVAKIFIYGGALSSLVIQPNGKIVAGGQSGGGSILVRFNPDGSLDGTRWDQFGYSSGFSALALQPDGKIVAGGGSFAGQYSTAADILVARFSPGDLVISGRVTTPFGGGLRNAVVTLTDSAGTRRTVVTSSLGFYSFGDIPMGETVTITVSSRRYRFGPVTRIMSESLSDVDLVALE